MTLPPLVALALGPVVAGAVWRGGQLTASGAVAAAVIGSVTALAGLDWIALLLCFFVTSVLLGRLGRTEKARRSAAVIEKSGPRDATQVLANGGLFAGAALLLVLGHDSPGLAVVALGALGAAMADTWGTEIGMLSRQRPRSILTWAALETGMSGGITMQGLLATLAGAGALAGVAWLLGWSASTAAGGAIGGLMGAMADSVLGATLQQRRRSLRTGRMTERTTDTDGRATVLAGGLPWLSNDGVNLAATVVGAGTAHQVHFLLSAVGAS